MKVNQGFLKFMQINYEVKQISQTNPTVLKMSVVSENLYFHNASSYLRLAPIQFQC